jgi:hypothetical protein
MQKTGIGIIIWFTCWTLQHASLNGCTEVILINPAHQHLRDSPGIAVHCEPSYGAFHKHVHHRQWYWNKHEDHPLEQQEHGENCFMCHLSPLPHVLSGGFTANTLYIMVIFSSSSAFLWSFNPWNQLSTFLSHVLLYERLFYAITTYLLGIMVVSIRHCEGKFKQTSES